MDYNKTVAECADIVIAQVNRQMPHTLDDSFIHVTEIDCLVETNVPIIALAPPKISNVELVEAGVVPEYGIAHLRGRTLRDRAKVLIEISHPDFREILWEEHKRRRIIAIGGGAVLDIAKIFALKNVTPILDLYDGKLKVVKSKKLIHRRYMEISSVSWPTTLFL